MNLFGNVSPFYPPTHNRNFRIKINHTTGTFNRYSPFLTEIMKQNGARMDPLSRVGDFAVTASRMI